MLRVTWCCIFLGHFAGSAATTSAPVVDLREERPARYVNKNLQAGTVIDARGVTFVASPDNRYPLSLAGEGGGCVAGLAVRGQYGRDWSWRRMHDLNNAGIAFANAGFVIDGADIDNVTDGIRLRPGPGFTIRNVRLTYIRDDCIENDHLEGGVMTDSLLDGCYVAFSARPSPRKKAAGIDGSTRLWTIRRSLIRLAPMPGPREGGSGGLGHGGFFKWHSWKDPEKSRSPKLALHDNIFMAEQIGHVGPERMGIPPGRLASCTNNVMVWLGPGDFPARLPEVCFTVTKDRRVWDRAVADWLRGNGFDASGVRTREVRDACGLPRAPR